MKHIVFRALCIAVILSLSCGLAGASLLDDLNAELSNLVKDTAPSVVEISSQESSSLPATGISYSSAYDGNTLSDPSARREVSLSMPGPFTLASGPSVGSGFVIDPAGYILTTTDVAKSDRVNVKFSDGSLASGLVVGRDNLTGIAVIRYDKNALKPLTYEIKYKATIENPGPRALELGDSDTLQPGHLVVCVNNQAGMPGSATLGMVSGLNRMLDGAGVIQISGTIGPGASGGPVIDSHGRVVAITFAMLSPTSTALPFNWPSVQLNRGKVWESLPSTTEDQLLQAEQSVRLKQLELSGAHAKLESAKRLADIAETRWKAGMCTQRDVDEARDKLTDAETAAGKAEIELEVAKGLLESAKKAKPINDFIIQNAEPTTRTSGSAGFAIPINRVKGIIDDLKAGKAIERGFLGTILGEKDGQIVLNTVTTGSPAEAAGLKAGDALVSVDGKRFTSVGAVTDYVRSYGPGYVMKIVVTRDGKECSMSVTLGKLQL